MKRVLLVGEQVCIKVPGMTELRAGLLSTSGCTLRLLDQDFEKHMNLGGDAVDLCLVLSCRDGTLSAPVMLHLDRLLFGAIPCSSIPVVIAVLAVSWLYVKVLSGHHKGLLSDN